MTTRRQKLQAMADQAESPHEAEIAREKLVELDASEAWMVDWERIEEHERIAAAQAAERQERELAELVRRWEHGTFTGMTLRAGAATTGLKEDAHA